MENKIYLKKNEEKRIKAGHLWVFSNEIFIVDGTPENGDIVDIYDSNKNFIASAFYNKNSLIACRVLSFNPVSKPEEILRVNILKANALRQALYPERKSYRLAFSESDFLPGLIIDKYENTYVLQVYSAGMENNLNLIADILKNEFGAVNIFTKNESNFRNLENLPVVNNILLGNLEKTVIDEFGILYEIDFENVQKTGFYFDQTDNRVFIEKISEGKSILDAFCNQGGFGLHALKANASYVDFVDSSELALTAASENCKLNKFDISIAKFHHQDVFKFLEDANTNNLKYDVVIVDPPAFAKNKKSIATAKKGYEKLNKLAMSVISDGGYLVTSSCSYHLSEEDFFEMLINAASKCSKNLQLIHFNNASLDHPELLAMKETVYLKFAIFKIN